MANTTTDGLTRMVQLYRRRTGEGLRSVVCSLRSGFTLIELLVVVAIIMLLAALLLPMLGNARAKSRSVACLSSIRQIGLAVQLYTDDWNDYFPRGHPISGGCYANGWAGVVYPYLGSRAVFACFEDPTKATAPRVPVSYYYNLNLAGRAANNTDMGRSWKQAELTSPVRTVLFWEMSGGTANVTDPNEANSCGYNGWHYPGGYPASGFLDLMWGGPWASTPVDGRHLFGANYVATDGHAIWLLPRGIRGVSAGETAGSTTAVGGGPFNSEGTLYGGTNRHELTMSPK